MMPAPASDRANPRIDQPSAPGRASPWSHGYDAPDMPPDADQLPGVDAGLFRGMVFALPFSLLLWWGIYALCRWWFA